jgi:hypothetical protein
MLSTKKLCMVSILRGETRFIDEWIIYHKLIGVNHFFLYDDDPDLPLSRYLEPHSAYVTVIPWYERHQAMEGRNRQTKAYMHALTELAGEFLWISFLDGDEFLVPRKHSSFSAFLEGFDETVGTVSLNWHTYGHNGFYDDPPGLITSSLTKREWRASVYCKSVSRVTAISGMHTVHFPKLKEGFSRVDANGRPFSDPVYDGKTAVAHINHYLCRSFSTWMSRVDTGNPTDDEPGHEWRTSKEGCLRRFIETIAVDNNEVTDLYMVGFRRGILDGLNGLKRRLNDRVTGTPVRVSLLEPKFTTFLASTADAIAQSCLSLAGSGLSTDRLASVAFLFQYSAYSGDRKLREQATTLHGELGDELDTDALPNLSNGLAGFGYLTEFFVQNRFISADTNESLEDLDDLLHYTLVSGNISSMGLPDGLLGIGAYFLSRLRNRFNAPSHPRIRKNEQVIAGIVDLLECSYNSYEDCIDAMNFLCEAHDYVRNQKKVLHFLRYAADKLETMLHEDAHFGFSPVRRYLLQAELAAVKASSETRDGRYTTTLVPLIRNHLARNEKAIDQQHGLDYWLLCNKLYKQTSLELYRDEAIYWLEGTAQRIGHPMGSEHLYRDFTGGKAAAGLALLTSFEEGFQLTDWLYNIQRK